MTSDPRTLYTERLAERRAEIAHRQRRHRLLGHGKLAMPACGVALVWLALAQGAFSLLWMLLPNPQTPSPIPGTIFCDNYDSGGLGRGYLAYDNTLPSFPVNFPNFSFSGN